MKTLPLCTCLLLMEMSVVPALFIGSKATGDHAAIGFGQMALSEIINRIAVLTNSKPGDNF